MKKWLKRIVLTFLISLTLLVGAVWILAVKYEEELKEYVIGELNDNLTRDIDLGREGLDYSILSHFPNISIMLPKLRVHSFEKGDQYFLNIDKVYLVFDLFELLDGDFTLKQVLLKDGEANVIFDKDGLPNYKIWKSSNDSTSSKTNFNIETVELDNMDVSYQHQGKDQDYRAHFKQLEMYPKSLVDSVVFGSTLTGEATKIKEADFEMNSPIALEGSFDLKYNQGDLEFGYDGLMLRALSNIQGKIKPGSGKNNDNLTLAFKTNGIGITSVVKILPEKLKNELLRGVSGNLSLNGKIQGELGNGSLALDCDYEWKNGTVKIKEETISDLAGKGRYQQPLNNYKKGQLQIEKLNGAFGLSTFEINGGVSKLNRPLFDMNLSSKVDLLDLKTKYLDEEFEQLEGEVNIETHIQGRLLEIFADQKSQSIKGVKSSGKIEFGELHFLPKGMDNPFVFDKGEFAFDNRNLDILNLSGGVNSTKFSMTGQVSNFLNTLIGKQALTFKANLKADKIKLEEFISADGSSEADSNYYFSLPKDLTLDVNLNLGQFEFRKFKGTNIKGDMLLRNQKLSFKKLNLNTCSGTATLSGKIAANIPKKVIFECTADLEKINAKEAFVEFENFGQDFLLARHVKGKISTNIYLLAETDRQLNVKKDKIYTKTKIKILNGELNAFEPMIELQEFLKEEFKMDFNLTNLKFKTLENDIEIINKKIYIPEMSIKTDDINMDIAGEHGFDQTINYLFKVKHSEIFKAKKQNKIDAKYGVKDNGDETATLPLRMSGTVENPKFSYDVQKKVDIIQENFKKEAENLKEILRQEFKGNEEERAKKKKEHDELNTERKKTKFEVGGIDDEDDEEEEEEDFEDEW